MKELRYYLRLYRLFFTQYIKTKVQYRADTLVSCLAMALVGVSGMFTYWIVFRSINNLNGLTYYEVMFMYSLYLIIISPAGILLNNLWNLKNHILEGTFVKYMLRPMNSLFYFVSEVVDIRGFVNLIIGSAFFIYSITKVNICWTLPKIIGLIILCISGMGVVCALTLLGASSSFYIMNAHFVNMFINKIIDFAKYPLSIYNIVLKIMFTVLLPIGFIAFYPTEFVLDEGAFKTLYVISPVIAVIFIVLSYWVWEQGIKRYSGTGS